MKIKKRALALTLVVCMLAGLIGVKSTSKVEAEASTQATTKDATSEFTTQFIGELLARLGRGYDTSGGHYYYNSSRDGKLFDCTGIVSDVFTQMGVECFAKGYDWQVKANSSKVPWGVTADWKSWFAGKKDGDKVTVKWGDKSVTFEVRKNLNYQNQTQMDSICVPGTILLKIAKTGNKWDTSGHMSVLLGKFPQVPDSNAATARKKTIENVRSLLTYRYSSAVSKASFLSNTNCMSENATKSKLKVLGDLLAAGGANNIYGHEAVWDYTDRKDIVNGMGSTYSPYWQIDSLNITTGVTVNNNIAAKELNSAIYGALVPVGEPAKQNAQIRIEKVDADNQGGKKLSGAQFALYEWSVAKNTWVTSKDYGIMEEGTNGTYRSYAKAKPATPNILITEDNLGRFRVVETKAPEGYSNIDPATGKAYEWIKDCLQSNPTGSADTTLSIRALNERLLGSMKVVKVWDDAGDIDGKRPESITVQLLQTVNGTTTPVAGKVITLNAANDWSGEFTDLPLKDSNGDPYQYTVTEDPVAEGYSVVYRYDADGEYTAGIATITNSFSATKKFSVQKSWNDGENKNGNRPDGIDVQLMQTVNGTTTPVVGELVTLNAANGWKKDWTALAKYTADGFEIVYSVKEVTVNAAYTTVITYSGPESAKLATVTNTEKTTEVEAEKQWNDGNDQFGVRPAAITVTLYASVNGSKEAVKSMDLTAANGWQYTFTDLPVYKNGVEITYTVEETAVTGYVGTMTKTGNRFVFTNTLTGKLLVEKVWNDSNNAEGDRPESIEVQLYADNAATEKKLTLTAADAWKGTFEDLPVFDAAGKKISYTVVELTPGYKVAYQYGDSTTYFAGTATITNSKTYLKSLTVLKSWEDDGNLYQNRPGYIEVQLFQTVNGTTTAVAGSVVKLNEGNLWRHTYEDLPKYENGIEIFYTVKELTTNIPGYTADSGTITYGGNEITKTATIVNTAEWTEYPVEKKWNDGNDEFSVRPESITVILYQTINGGTPRQFARTTLNAANGWKDTFTRLPVCVNGKTVSYFVEELPVEHYEGVTDTTLNGTIIENTLKGSLVILKKWEDHENVEGDRPAEITVELYRNGSKVADSEKKLTAANGYRAAYDELALFAPDGTKYSYTVKELVNGYQVTYSQITYTGTTGEIVITNTKDYQTEFFAEKEWRDGGNKAGNRTAIEVQLYADGKAYGTPVTLSEANLWKYTWENLPKYDGTRLIVYTVKELTILDAYTTNVTYVAGGAQIINTEKQTEYPVEKKWVDGNDRYGLRPTTIEVTLYRNVNGTLEEVDSVLLSALNGWKHTFTDLPAYVDGQKVTYTAKETRVEHYAGTMENGIFTNTLVKKLEVEKKWNDGNDEYQLRPERITVTLYRDGVKADEAVLSDATGWKTTFERLAVYAADGHEYVYTVTEESVANYLLEKETTAKNPDAETIAKVEFVNTITGSHSAIKTWLDADDCYKHRADSVTLKLYADGVEVGSGTLDYAGGWKCEWNELPLFDTTGKKIVYTVSEEELAEYVASINTRYDNSEFLAGITYLTNKLLLSVDVTKEWNDGSNEYGLRDQEVRVTLFANGVETGSAVLSDANSWYFRWSDLPAVDENGNLILYTVKEEVTGPYQPEVSYDEAVGITGIEKHAVVKNTLLKDVVAEKTWNDGDNTFGLRPENVTVELYRNGVLIDTAVLSEANGWKHVWEKLPVYDVYGAAFTYTTKELPVANYEGEEISEASGVMEIIHVTYKNTLYGSYRVNKVWLDLDDLYERRPDAVTVWLLADGVETGMSGILSAASDWTHEWTGLPVYRADGQKIVYSVREEAVENYESSTVYQSDTADALAGACTLTNGMYGSFVVDKIWNDFGNANDLRQGSVTVLLMQNGIPYGEAVVLSEENAWHHEWDKLPLTDASGNACQYTIEEAACKGYIAGVVYRIDNSGNKWAMISSLINTELGQFRVKKNWNDGDDTYGNRPESIAVTLLSNGFAVGDPVYLNEENNWEYVFTDLPVYDLSGNRFVYTVSEAEVDSYDSVTVYSDSEEYTCGTAEITNTLWSGFRVIKKWLDHEDEGSIRPISIEMELFANDVKYGETVTLTAENGWEYVWEHLPMYGADGEPIRYAAKEAEHALYGPFYSYFYDDEAFLAGILTLSNVELTELGVKKVWDVTEGTVLPDEVTIHLLQNGSLYDTAVLLAEEGYQTTFGALPKYDLEGNLYSYAIEETAIEGFFVKEIIYEEQMAVITNSGITIEKLDGENGLAPMSGCVFEVYDSTGTLVARFEAAGEGMLLPFVPETRMEYTIREVSCPDGYALAQEQKFVVNAGDGAKVITFVNYHLDIPVTGDRFPVAGWLFAMLVALAGMVFVVFRRRRF